MSQQTEPKEPESSDSIQEISPPGSGSFIGDFPSAPNFMQDNDNIRGGYRINFQSKKRLLKSLFMVHNESVNIWTHLLPFFIFLGLLVSFVMIVDLAQFKKEISIHKQDLEKVFGDYFSSLQNLTRVSLDQTQTDQAHTQNPFLKQKVLQKYDQVLQKAYQQSGYLGKLISNIEGVKTSFKEELKLKLYEIQRFKQHYQTILAPRIINAVGKTFDSEILESLNQHALTLKHHLDSHIYQPIQLHHHQPNPQEISRWPLFVFLSSAVLCLLFSTVFHLFNPLSSKAYGLLLRFDFAGISLLIAGSAFPPFYYSFYCHFAVAEIYLTCTVVAALVCFVISLFQWIHKVENMKYRAVVFGAFAMSAVVPLTHLAINQIIFDNFGDPYRFSSSCPYYIALISSYCFGLYVFVAKCPQRNNPGKYDICGHSHQLWHCLVVLGIVFTYFGVLENYKDRKQSICPT